MAGGRPTLYKPEYIQRVIEYGKEGRSLTQIAARLDVSRDTIYAWCSEISEFSDAIMRARELAQDWWETQGQSGLANREFNAPLWAKSMAARFPQDYTEARRTEISGPNGGPVRLASELTDDELATIAAASGS